MRVLWFSNTPSLAAEVLKDKGNIGGWISSLEREISRVQEIELGVAFHYGYSDKKQFEVGNTKYYSFPYPLQIKGNIKGLYSRWKHNIEPSNIVDLYLEVVELFKPDIIHIFGSEQAFGLITDKVKVPVIVQIQGNLSVYEKKWFSGLSYSNILRHSNIKTIIYGYGVWHQYFLFRKRAIREIDLLKKCNYIIGRTDWDRRITRVLSPNSKYFHCDELLRSDFYGSKHVIHAHNNIMILISTMSLMNYKGIETILETALLLKKHKLLDFEWQIIGIKGTEELIQIIEKTYHQRFVEFGIKFFGNLNSADLVKVLLEADCYIHPSHIENSPNSVCEAMLLGLPVIATYAGGTSSLIIDSEDGILVQDGDPYSLAGAILELVKDNDLKAKFSFNAERKARERHDYNKVLKDLLNIYDTVLSDNS